MLRMICLYHVTNWISDYHGLVCNRYTCNQYRHMERWCSQLLHKELNISRWIDLSNLNPLQTFYCTQFIWFVNIKKEEVLYGIKMSATTEIRCPKCNSLYVAPSPENKNRLECKECGTLF